MVTSRVFTAILVLAAAGYTPAQPRPADPPCAVAGAASGPARGYGPGPHARWGSEDTPGWPMMSPDERQVHRERMGGFTSYPDCRKYMDLHHDQMAARAKERGLAMPGRPMHDACGPLRAASQP